MGQAVVDLPDPLEQPPASASSADDLLSQLAGDEIDRLLTEADVEAAEEVTEPAEDAALTVETPTADASSAASDGIAMAPAAATESTAASDTGEVNVAASATIDVDTLLNTPDAAGDAAPAETTTAAELDAILGSVTSPEAATIDAANEPSTAELTAVPTTAGDLDHAIAAGADQVLPPQTAELRAEAAAEVAKTTVEHDERQELLATVAAETTEEPDTVAPLPIWLRPLEWMNAPLDGLSDSFREFIGKAALLTIFNSIAAIVYVMFFRRH